MLGVKAGMRFTLNRRNAADLDAVLDLVEENGVPRFCMYHLVYAGRGKEMVADDLEPSETRRIVEHLLDRTKDWHERGVVTEVLTTDNHADGILVSQRVAKDAPERSEDVRELLERAGGCSAGTKMANVDASGNVFLADPRHEYTTGATLLVDGGISLPWWARSADGPKLE